MRRICFWLCLTACVSMVLGCESAVLVNNDAGRTDEPAMEAQPARADMSEDAARDAQPAQAEMSVETTDTRVEKQND